MSTVITPPRALRAANDDLTSILAASCHGAGRIQQPGTTYGPKEQSCCSTRVVEPWAIPVPKTQKAGARWCPRSSAGSTWQRPTSIGRGGLQPEMTRLTEAFTAHSPDTDPDQQSPLPPNWS